MLAYGEWLEDNVLAPVPHRQYVFTLPKLARPFFRCRRRYLGELCRLVAALLNAGFKVMAPAGQPAFVLYVQTFGESGGLQVDFNVIPLALVDRIETIGVGGAPIYGSDAIVGTVNVILKDRFEGVQLSLGTGGTSDSDADYNAFTLVAGANFSDGRGNVTMSMEAFRQTAQLAG